MIDGIEHKKCVGECGETKPLSEFGAYKQGGKTYYRGECKECIRKIDAAKQKAKRADPKKNAKINEQRRERNKIPERKAIIKEQHSTPEYLARDAELQRIRRLDPEFREKYNEQQKKRLEDPVKRETKNAAQRISAMTEDEIAKKNAYERERRKDPEVKALKKMYDQKPENRAKNAALIRNRRKDPTKIATVRLWDAKHHYTKLGRGCKLINNWFDGCEMHHIWTNEYGNHDPDTVVCIPSEPHQAIKHCGDASEKANVKHGDGMIEITEYIYTWYKETNPTNTNTILWLQYILDATKERVARGWENTEGWKEHQEFKKNLIEKKMQEKFKTANKQVNEKENIDYWL